MKKILGYLLLALLSTASGLCQSTITATISDPDGTAWASLNGYNATYSATLVSSTGVAIPAGQAYRIDTGATVTNPAPGNMDASGTFSVALASNNNIRPTGTQWQFKLCPAVTSAICNTVTLTVNASGTLSTQLSTGATAPRIGGGIGNYAYNDGEVAAIPNNSYLNITTPIIRCYATSWATCGSGGSGPPTGAAGGALSGTYPNPGVAALIPVLQNVQYLNASSEIGAQCNAALTALGSAGGIIQLPNSLSLTMTTTCANIPQSVSVRGYGKFATKIACSVAAGDCFQITQNPTSNGATAGKFSDFEIDGASSANPILIHGTGASGWTFDNIQFNPYGGATANAAICLELDDTGSGTFVERNTITPNANFERQCTPGLYLHQNGGDSSFAYNHFDVDGVSQGTNYLVVVDGAARLYGGWLKIAANHVGPGGGILQFNGSAGTSGPLNPSEFLEITAEEDGTGSGEVIDASSSGALNFSGTIMNGPGGAGGLATLIGGAHAADVYISGPLGAQGSVSTAQSGVAIDNNYSATNGATPRSMFCPNIGGGQWCEALVGHDSGAGNSSILEFFYEGNNSASSLGILGMPGSSAIEWDHSGNTTVVGENLKVGDGTFGTIQHIGNHTWFDEISSTGQYLWFDTTISTTPFYITTAGSPYNNQIGVGSASILGFSSQAQFANNAALDTGISRTAAAAFAFGNGTQGNTSGKLALAGVTLSGGTVPTITGCGTISAQAGGATAGTFTTTTTGTCTAAFALPTVAHGYTCEAYDITQHTATNILIQSTTSTTGCTVTGTTVASDVITFAAWGW